MARIYVLLLLVATLVAGASARPAQRNLKQTIPAPQLTQRVVFDPNRGENNKVQDYIANVYIGEALLAQADPTAAGAGGGVSTQKIQCFVRRSCICSTIFSQLSIFSFPLPQAGAGVQLTYDKSSYFDYETFASRADVGPGAKAVGAAVARVLGIGTAKAAGKGFGKSNLGYKRDAAAENAVALGTVNELGLGVSGGLYLDRASGKDNSALLQAPQVNFAFGH